MQASFTMVSPLKHIYKYHKCRDALVISYVSHKCAKSIPSFSHPPHSVKPTHSLAGHLEWWLHRVTPEETPPSTLRIGSVTNAAIEMHSRFLLQAPEGRHPAPPGGGAAKEGSKPRRRRSGGGGGRGGGQSAACQGYDQCRVKLWLSSTQGEDTKVSFVFEGSSRTPLAQAPEGFQFWAATSALSRNWIAPFWRISCRRYSTLNGFYQYCTWGWSGLMRKVNGSRSGKKYF